jgi:hypothetical protein
MSALSCLPRWPWKYGLVFHSSGFESALRHHRSFFCSPLRHWVRVFAFAMVCLDVVSRVSNCMDIRGKERREQEKRRCFGYTCNVLPVFPTTFLSESAFQCVLYVRLLQIPTKLVLRFVLYISCWTFVAEISKSWRTASTYVVNKANTE